MSTALISSVRRLADERPDETTPYYYTFNPGDNKEAPAPYCILGHALAESGVPLHEFDDKDTRPLADFQLFPSEAPPTISAVLAPLTSEEMYWLMYVQHQQDHDCTWEEAVAAADLQYPEMNPNKESTTTTNV